MSITRAKNSTPVKVVSIFCVKSNSPIAFEISPVSSINAALTLTLPDTIKPSASISTDVTLAAPAIFKILIGFVSSLGVNLLLTLTSPTSFLPMFKFV